MTVMQLLSQGGPPPGPPPPPPTPGLSHVESLIAQIVIFAVAAVFLYLVKFRGYTFQVRKLPALDAIEEAVGRATEMDKPIWFEPAGAGPGG